MDKYILYGIGIAVILFFLVGFIQETFYSDNCVYENRINEIYKICFESRLDMDRFFNYKKQINLYGNYYDNFIGFYEKTNKKEFNETEYFNIKSESKVLDLI